jgi:hypothetical protein
MVNFGEWNSTALRFCAVMNVIDSGLLKVVFFPPNGHFRMANLLFPSVDHFDLQAHLSGSGFLISRPEFKTRFF